MQTAVGPGLGAGLLGSLSYLEAHKVTHPTLQDYARKAKDFIDMARYRHWDRTLDEELAS